MSRLSSVLPMPLRRGGEVKAVFALLNKEGFARALLRLVQATGAPAKVGEINEEK